MYYFCYYLVGFLSYFKIVPLSFFYISIFFMMLSLTLVALSAYFTKQTIFFIFLRAFYTFPSFQWDLLQKLILNISLSLVYTYTCYYGFIVDWYFLMSLASIFLLVNLLDFYNSFKFWAPRFIISYYVIAVFIMILYYILQLWWQFWCFFHWWVFLSIKIIFLIDFIFNFRFRLF